MYETLQAIPVPYIEVHMTNAEKRGVRSVTAEVAIAGFGVRSYLLGLDAMLA